MKTSDVLFERVMLHTDYLNTFGYKDEKERRPVRHKMACLLEALALKLRGAKPHPHDVGQAVLRDIAQKGYVLTPIPSSDPTQLAFNSGKRDLAMRILSFCYDDHTKMVAQLQKERDKNL